MLQVERQGLDAFEFVMRFWVLVGENISAQILMIIDDILRLTPCNYIIIQNNIPQMQGSQIALYLKDINLNLDPGTISAVHTHLTQKIGFLHDIQIQFQLYAGVAIVSQTETRPTIGHQSHSTNGIKIQNVMSHLGPLSKERFLDTANRQLQKYKQAPQYLKKKVEDVRYSYRFYKKYQATFQELWKLLSIGSKSKDELSAMFWVLFLYIKNSHIETENITESKSFLILLFRMIFEKFLVQAQFPYLFLTMQQQIGSIPPIPAEKYQHYLALVQAKLNQFYSQRFSQSKVNFPKLINNYTMIDRLVDDMSNAYAKEMRSLKFYNDIDELSYLELKKNLTPQVFRKPFVMQEPRETINTMLSFGSDDEGENEGIQIEQQPQIKETPSKRPIIEGSDGLPTPKPTQLTATISPNSTPKFLVYSSPARHDLTTATPITTKCNLQSWMNKRIDSVSQERIRSFQKFFSELSAQEKNPDQIIQESQPFAQQSTLKTCIYKLIQIYRPKCSDYQSRFSRIMALIISNFSQIQLSNKQLFGNMTSLEDQRNLVLGIACVSCEIFNFVHNSISYEFKVHCQVFGSSTKTAFQSLALFSKDLTSGMPIDLRNYLQKTMKRFFVYDIWQNGQGYKILCEYSSKPSSQYPQIQRKLISSVQNRIKQICRQANIQSKIITKTQNMIKFIFTNKPYLLKSNNIDQIILCCIMSCLSINEKEENQTLELLFNKYNGQIEFSFNSNQSNLKDQYGNDMKIVDYYNEVFLAEIQDMLAEKQDQLDDFLLTPVRITKRYSGPNLEINLKKKQQKPSTGMFMFNPERLKTSKSDYRKSILKQDLDDMKEQRQEEEQDKDLPPSPTFAMTRTFTFADLSKK